MFGFNGSLLLIYVSLLPMALAIKVGDTFCTEGYVMDFFCINRGRLLDRNDIVSLEEPNKHTLHCLLDVPSCTNDMSPYEVLVEPNEDGGLYTRGWRMTDASKQKMIKLGRSVGICTTCASDGELKEGFRAVFTATLLALNSDNALRPPEIEIDMLRNSNNLGENPCQTEFNMDDILDILDPEERDALFSSGAGNGLRRMHLIHGSLMLIGWGFLLPAGTIIARFFKHRPNGLWFKIHRACQMTGLLIAIIGWIIALINFSVFGDKGNNNYRHGVMGMVTMIMGLLQPLNAFFRPHNPEEGENKSTPRCIWEHYHKGVGWATIFLAVGTIILGTFVIPTPGDQKFFRFVYIGMVATLLIGFGMIKRDKYLHSQMPGSKTNIAHDHVLIAKEESD